MRSGPPIADELLPFLPAEPASGPFMSGVEGIQRLRAAMAEYYEDPDAVAAEAGVVIEHLEIDGVPVFEIVPPATRQAPRSVVMSVHGGGLVAGSYRNSLLFNARLAIELDSALVVPEYRLAPEHPYPAALDDISAVWRWLREAAPERGYDADRLVLMGGSAGGMLAASLAVRLRDAGEVAPRALVLVQPQLDDRNELPSTHELEHEHFWDRSSNLLSWQVYLAGVEEITGAVVPARASDLRGMPPTYIEIGQVDLFRDEAIEFASRLSRDGVPVELHVWAGGFHAFDGQESTVVARRALAVRREYLRGACRPE